MLRRWLVLALVVFAVVLLPRSHARADQSTAHSVSVAVLAFDSDDAEEQADALTGALRSRIRASQGWSLIETSQSLGMLTAALRCQSKPISAECEQKIADQIKSERYIFGYVTKGPQPNQVTAEIHLYQKSKPDTVIRESYADNLKDQNDDTLRKIAQRVLERLGGTAVGTIVVRMGSENGEVIVDGDKRVPLERGTARLELSAGGHSVEVAVAGQAPQKRNILVAAGKETVVDLALASTSTAPHPASETPFPTRKVVGGGLVALGIGAGVFATVMGLGHLDAKKEGEAYAKGTGPENPEDPRLPPGMTPDQACDSGALRSNTTICKKEDEARTKSVMFWVATPAAAVFLLAGAYFLFTDGGSDERTSTTTGKAAPPKPRVKAAPSIGYNSAGLILSGSF